MPRNMSFMLTTEQIRNRTKTVTRRKGWTNVKVGEIINACVKCMGLKPGEKIERICQIRVTNVRRESLSKLYGQYGLQESGKEGFPGQSGHKFVSMFVNEMGGEPDQVVTRIEFEYLDDPNWLIRQAMRDPDHWVLKLRYKDSDGATTIRTVSPYRLDADSMLVLCLAREECRRLKLANCSDIELVAAADVLMPVAIEVVN